MRIKCTIIPAKCKNINKSYEIYKRREKPYSENIYSQNFSYKYKY